MFFLLDYDTVDGKWSGWISNDKDCVLEEGNWMKPASRRCDNPPPLFGGHSCQGQNQTKLECQAGNETDLTELNCFNSTDMHNGFE